MQSPMRTRIESRVTICLDGFRAPEDESTRFRSGALSGRPCLARSTTRSTFYLALPGLTLTAGFPDLRWLTRTTLAFWPPPAYGSGGLAMAVLADAAPCGPVTGRTCKR
jgi:hypothetical protein